MKNGKRAIKDDILWSVKKNVWAQYPFMWKQILGVFGRAGDRTVTVRVGIKAQVEDNRQPT